MSQTYQHVRRLVAYLLIQFFNLLPFGERLKTVIKKQVITGMPRFVSFITVAEQADAIPWPADPRLEDFFKLQIPDPEAVSEVDFGFQPVQAPSVSIIVPVYNKSCYTLTCLKFLNEMRSDIPFEVIVVDDCSNDDTQSLLRQIEGISCIRNAENIGFVRSCNRGASEARGEYIVFLNNDTAVQKGWLDELLRTVEEQENAGLVGSQLVYADGTLQEAGALVWRDGTGWNYGRGEDPKRPEFNFLRGVSYCSGASFLISRDLFRQVGGFDERYAPAYYEDTDLAFAVNEAGRQVLYQPLSRVVHFEGITGGTDVKQGTKKFQAINHAKFMEKWSSQLENAPAKLERNIVPENYIDKRVLIIDSYTPTPDQDSGSVDAFYLMKIMRSLSYSVTFIPEDDRRFMDSYTRDLQRLGVRCLYSPYLGTTEVHLKNFGEQYDVVFLARVDVAYKLVEPVRKYCPRAKLVFNTVDLHYLRTQREAELTGSSKIANAAEITRAKELDVIAKADCTILKSSEEMDIVKAEVPMANLFRLPLIIEVEDAGFTPFHQRQDIFFLGGFRHPPNVNAVTHFVENIWSRIRAQLKDVEFHVIGSNMPEEVLNIDCAGVNIIGHVDDLSPYFNRCRLMVAPLLYGAGVKGKIGRSLGYGVPTVATSIAIEGMGLNDDTLDVKVANSDDEFADAVIDLYSDETQWNRISENGQKFFEQNLTVGKGKETIRELFQSI